MGQIIERDALNNLYKLLNKKESKIVTTNGVFDILHDGHLETFRTMRKLAGYMGSTVVFINSDTSVRALKGDKRPINDQNFRAKMLSRLVDVDYVVIFDELNPIKVLKEIKPDFHVKSVSGYKGLEGNVVRKYGGTIILLEDIPNISSTNIIDKIKELY